MALDLPERFDAPQVDGGQPGEQVYPGQQSDRVSGAASEGPRLVGLSGSASAGARAASGTPAAPADRRSQPLVTHAVIMPHKSPALLMRKKPLGVDGGHAARARGGHRLPVDVVGHIAAREHTRHVGGGGCPGA